MTLFRRSWQVWGVALGLLAAVVPAEARQTGPATPPQAQQADPYVVGQARPPVAPGARLMDLTLEQAIAVALEKNLDLKVERMNAQGVDYQLQAARAAFNPQMTSSYSYNNSKAPSNVTLDGVATVTTVGQGFNGGVTQTLPWHGAAFGVNFTNNRSATNNVTARLNPSYTSNLRLTFNMPLLAGFAIDNTRNQLRTLAITRQITDLTLLSAIENLRANVRTAYWALRSAIEQIEIQQRALDLARRSLEDTRIKVEIGTAAPIEQVTFEAQVATAEQQRLNAEISWRTAELNLKRYLVTGTDDELYRTVINPTDAPRLSVQSVDIQAAVTAALAERTDIVTSLRNIESSQLSLEVTANQTKPSLQLNGGYTLAGQGGTQRSTVGGVTTILPGGYGDALRAIAGLDTPTWNFGFNFTYPLGMRAAKANYARAQLTLAQSQIRLESQKLTISTEVINAGLAVENAYKQYQAAVKSREAQERNAQAAQTRFDVGALTNFEVVTAQQTLTNARLTELGRLIAYVNAIAEFERVQKVGR
jgi:outer membrane protein TolC